MECPSILHKTLIPDSPQYTSMDKEVQPTITTYFKTAQSRSCVTRKKSNSVKWLIVTKLIILIISQYIHVSSHYTVHPKLIQFICQFFLNKNGGKMFHLANSYLSAGSLFYFTPNVFNRFLMLLFLLYLELSDSPWANVWEIK